MYIHTHIYTHACLPTYMCTYMDKDMYVFLHAYM